MWDVTIFKQNLTPVCQVGVRCEMWHFSNRISLQSARLVWDVRCEMSHFSSRISLQPGRLEWDYVWKMSHLTSHPNLADWSEILFEKSHISHLTPAWQPGVRCEMWDLSDSISLQPSSLERDSAAEISYVTSHSSLVAQSEILFWEMSHLISHSSLAA